MNSSGALFRMRVLCIDDSDVALELYLAIFFHHFFFSQLLYACFSMNNMRSAGIPSLSDDELLGPLAIARSAYSSA